MLLFSLAYGKTLRFGMSAAFTGPAAALGTEMRQGIEAYFKKVNQSSGIHGNTLQLVAMDDRYEPYLSKRNMERLVKNKDILAIIGNVGTPTALVNVPIAIENKILLFGTFSGANVLRNNPPDRYVINYRASYAQEAEVLVKMLLQSGIKPQNMALFTQNDAYGNEGYLGTVQALEYAGFSREIIDKIPHGRYTHNTINVEPGLNKILKDGKHIDAFIIIGSYKPVAKFIKMAKEYFPDSYYLNVSFVGAIPLLQEICKKNRVLAKEYSKNIILAQTVPHYNSKLPAAKEFISSLHEFYPDAKPTFVSFEGYIVAKLLAKGLERAGRTPTRESLIDAFESLNKIDVGIGYPLTISKECHQASSKVWLTVFKYNVNPVILQKKKLILEKNDD